MKFTWIQDLDFMSQSGGAQNTDKVHFLEGIRRGHDMSILTPQADSNILLTDDSPVIISNMMAGFRLELFQQLVERRKPCIWFFHDYQPLCKYRLFYPMLGKCKSCHRKENWLPIFLEARLLIWLSPLHRESWLWSCPELEQKPYAIVPSPIEPSQFYDMKLPREGIICVTSLFEFKGRKCVLQWAKDHSDQKITCVGGNPLPGEPLPPNCRDVGQIPPWQMNETYNKHKMFLHLPATPQPFDRTVPEAYLAGCDVIGNKLVGALSYDWFRSRGEVAEHCGSSSRLFWEKIEGVLND